MIVADSALVQTTVRQRAPTTNPSPLPRLIVDSFMETDSTITPPSDCRKPMTTANRIPLRQDGQGWLHRPWIEILSASPWRGIGYHAREVHVLAHENAEYDGIIESIATTK